MIFFENGKIKVERHGKTKMNGVPVNRIWKYDGDAWVFNGYWSGFSFQEAYDNYVRAQEENEF